MTYFITYNKPRNPYKTYWQNQVATVGTRIVKGEDELCNALAELKEQGRTIKSIWDATGKTIKL